MPSSAADKKWKAMYEELVRYKETMGHCGLTLTQAKRQQSPDVHSYQLIKLAKWVERQRDAHRKGTLREDRRLALNEMEFFWSGNDIVWYFSHFLEVKKFIKGETDDGSSSSSSISLPEVTSDLNDENNGIEPEMAWIREQRLQYIKHQRGYHSRISLWRINKLNLIGFPWTATNPEIQTALEESAETENLRYMIRKFPNNMAEWSKITGAISAAKEKHASTGEPAFAVYEECAYNRTYLAKEKDGTFVLMYQDDINTWLDQMADRDDKKETTIFPQPILFHSGK